MIKMIHGDDDEIGTTESEESQVGYCCFMIVRLRTRVIFAADQMKSER